MAGKRVNQWLRIEFHSLNITLLYQEKLKENLKAKNYRKCLYKYDQFLLTGNVFQPYIFICFFTNF